ncbi:MAG: 1,4-alpha-glucan branching protein GlgB [Candidatus Avilachnospira sp.]|jgi:1,4-alpha-glucan branching enzyme
MNEKLFDIINWADVEEITYSESSDPKRILGAHELERGLLIQAFVPHAVSITAVLEDGSEHVLEKADEGFFAALIEKRKLCDYKLKLRYDNDYEEIKEDPYNPKFKESFTEEDAKKFKSGILYNAYEKLGAHLCEKAGVKGVRFAVWAPNAVRVSVVGDFNMWDGRLHEMEKLGDSGVFELFIPDLKQGDIYKYEVKFGNRDVGLKSDPYGFYSELRPATASVVWDIDSYKWQDGDWTKKRAKANAKTSPINIYEVHLGSWKMRQIAVDENGEEINGSQFINYRETAEELAAYMKEMGYTHLELMPVMEHPFDGSWGYQVTGYYAPTSRYGDPDDFKYFVDYMHREGIAVIVDWVPAHFPRDTFALAEFDGTHLYDHPDPRLGAHPHWGTLIFNYGRAEVSNFLIANAMFWAEKYHIDGIRMDAVASMLYLDYGRNNGEWLPNIYGGNENLVAVEFLKHLNSMMHKLYPDVIMIAEESTAWPMITGKVEDGGLGFDYKWNMGFMNDFLRYMSTDPYFRKDNYGALTFPMFYNYSENFILVFSHDEVVHGKASLLGKMAAADMHEKAKQLRAAYGFFMTHPDKKLLFMGQEFAQYDEWSEARSLEWELLQYPVHKNMQSYMKELNSLYLEHPAFYKYDYDQAGFEWINCSYNELSIAVFLRKTEKPEETMLVVSNFDTMEHKDFKIGVPFKGSYKEIFNSDSVRFGGSGEGNPRAKRSVKADCDGRENSIKINIPPMSVLVFSCTPTKEKEAEKKNSTKEKQKPKADTKTKNEPSKKAKAIIKAVKDTASKIIEK